MIEIGPKLWLGNALEIRDPKLLFDLQIQAIVDLAYEEQPAVPARSFLYQRFPLTDSEGNDHAILRFAIQSLAQLLDAELTTAVGCSAGMSRSPTIAAFASSLHSGENPQDVIERIAQERALEINPALWREVQSCFDETFDRR